MSTYPKRIVIFEEGPREGFQIEPGPIPTERKIELIDALSRTGLTGMKIASFVNPKLVPGMADSEAVVAGITQQPGVAYHGLWFNERGLERALSTKRLNCEGGITLTASEAFLRRNKNRSQEEDIAMIRKLIGMYESHDIPVTHVGVSAAFGCNFQGVVEVDYAIGLIRQALDIADEHNCTIKEISINDTMAWATPNQVKVLMGAVQDNYPDYKHSIHLHDTRGMGIANAVAALEMGIDHFDSCVAGLGGCPFAGHAGAAGNVCTEDLVFMCEEMGIETGIDLDAMIECARLAEDIVGHPLPGSVMKGGTLSALRAKYSGTA